MNAKKRVTISDIAREAGVSIKTVSRVVRREENVKEDTRKAVQEIIKKLNYRPTVAPRTSADGHSFIIGLIFDNPNPSYTSDLMKATLLETRSNGFHLEIEPINANGKDLGELISNMVIQGNMAGLVLPPPLCDRSDVLNAVKQIGRPVARIAPGVEMDVGIIIQTDDRNACAAMTRHLIKKGHRRIGFIKGREGTATTRRRLDGYQSALADAGIPADDTLIQPGDYRFESGYQAAKRLLALPSRPTAIFASNDDMAAGAIGAATEAGLELPSELSICGFDDSIVASVVWPLLTTVKQPVEEMAQAAVKALTQTVRKATDAPEGPITIPCELVHRDSVADAPEA